MRFLLFIVFLFLFDKSVVAQVESIPVSEWVKKLSDPEDKKNQASRFLWDSVVKSKDSTRMNRLLLELKANAGKNSYFNTRLNLYEALVLNSKDIFRTSGAKTSVMKLMKQAMQTF